jgi:hypothetical protein
VGGVTQKYVANASDTISIGFSILIRASETGVLQLIRDMNQWFLKTESFASIFAVRVIDLTENFFAAVDIG